MAERRRPVVALTLGDPAGIGPVAALAAARDRSVGRVCELVFVGEDSCWRRAGWRPSDGGLVDTGLGGRPPAPGRPTAASGRLSFVALGRACALAGRRLVDAVVTAPVSKRAWELAGVPYIGHTEFLRERFGSPRAEMVLAAPSANLWTVSVTRHVPLRSVPAALSVAAVVSCAQALSEALTRLGRRRPILGLCALNPHAGEGGLLGKEEGGVLASAVARARRAGTDLRGPVAADTAWRLHRAGELEGLVCLYHDQALIGLKTAAGLGGINWTAGLPIARTSPAHGTAFDLALKRGRPDPTATIEAVLLAARLAARG